jgi:hypothetical protein
MLVFRIPIQRRLSPHQNPGMNPKLKYRVVIHNNDWPLAQDWCEQYIGKFNYTWYKLGIDPVAHLFEQQTETESVWYFQHERDAMLFKLKWS